jgi:hypothetical protein
VESQQSQEKTEYRKQFGRFAGLSYMDDVESRNAPTELDSDAVQNVGVEFEVT